LLGQAGKSVGIFEILGSDTCRCKLSLDEVEPDERFLLIVGTKLDLSSCCCRNRLSRVMFESSEKAGKVQRFDGHLSQEEKELVGTEGQNNERTDKSKVGLKTENEVVGWNVTHSK
jgi:hypothetical protein